MEEDSAYYQSTVWAWLIGPFVEAHLCVYNHPARGQQFLLPVIHHLADRGLGSICELPEGAVPHCLRA